MADDNSGGKLADACYRLRFAICGAEQKAIAPCRKEPSVPASPQI
jgi:hypothetical protein